MPEDASSLITVTTLGELRVLRNGVVWDGLQSRPLLLAMLCYLALERSASRDRLLSLFWEGREPGKARHALSQAIYTLRTRLGQHWIETDARGIRVNELIWADVLDFEEHLKRGRPLEALALNGGVFLEGFFSDSPAFEHWAAGRRALVNRALRDAFRNAISLKEAAGDTTGALAIVRDWVQHEPDDDEANQKLIELFARTGDRAAALRHFELFRRALLAEQLTPLGQTEELVDRIRAGTFEAEPPDVARPESVGASRDEQSATGPVAPAAKVKTHLWGGTASAGPRLVRIVEDGSEAEAYPLSRGRTVIGRSEGDLVFPDDGRLDHVHASFIVRAAGPSESVTTRYVIRDEGSTGGVFMRIRGEWPLRPGDVIAAGQQVFRLDRQD